MPFQASRSKGLPQEMAARHMRQIRRNQELVDVGPGQEGVGPNLFLLLLDLEIHQLYASPLSLIKVHHDLPTFRDDPPVKLKGKLLSGSFVGRKLSSPPLKVSKLEFRTGTKVANVPLQSSNRVGKHELLGGQVQILLPSDL